MNMPFDRGFRGDFRKCSFTFLRQRQFVTLPVAKHKHTTDRSNWMKLTLCRIVSSAESACCITANVVDDDDYAHNKFPFFFILFLCLAFARSIYELFVVLFLFGSSLRKIFQMLRHNNERMHKYSKRSFYITNKNNNIVIFRFSFIAFSFAFAFLWIYAERNGDLRHKKNCINLFRRNTRSLCSGLN